MKALNVINSVSNTAELGTALKSYSINAVEAAIAQSTLTEEQIKAILVSRGYSGELLKNTTTKLANVTSTNALAASQAGATATTSGLSLAFRGLAASIKSLVLAHPILAGISIALGTLLIGVKAVDAINVSAEESRKKLSEMREEYDQNKSELESLNSELETTASRMDELEAKGHLSLTEQEELLNLQKQNAELERTIRLKESEQRIDAKKLAEQASETYDKYTHRQNVFNQNVEDRAYNQGKIIAYKNTFDKNRYNGKIDLDSIELEDDFGANRSNSKDINYLIASYEVLKKEQESVANNIDKIAKRGSLASEEELEQAESLQSYYDSINDKILETESLISDYASTIEESRNAFQLAESLGIINDEQKQDLAEIESFFTQYDKLTNTASDAENAINNLFAKAKFEGVKDSLVSAGEEGSNAVLKLISTVPGLTDELNNAGISAQQLCDYIMAISDPDSLNISNIKEQLRKAFADDDYEREPIAAENADKAFGEFLSGKSDKEIEIFYKYVQKNDLDMSDWTKDDLEYNFSLSMDTTEAVEELDAITESTTTALSGINSVKDALASQGTGASIDLETFNSDELKEYRSALEYVNGSLQLNSEKVRELTEAKVKEQIATNKITKAQEQSKYLENASEIEELRDKLNGLDTSSEEYQDTLSQIQLLQSNNSAIIDQCTQIDLLNASLRESIGVYQQWKDAQNASESGDMFDDTKEMYQLIKDTNDAESDLYGRVGNANYQAAVDFLVPESIDHSDMEAVNKYINDVKRYLTFDEDKNIKGLDIENFMADSVEKGLMEIDEKTGEYKLAGARSMEEFADGLNLSLPMVQAIFGELEEYLPEGSELEWSDGEQTLGDLAVNAGEAANALSTLDEYKNLKIDLDVSDLSTDEEKINALNDNISKIKNFRAKFEVDSSEYEYANQLISYCVAQEQLLNQPVVMSVDTSGLDEDSDAYKAITMLQELQQAVNSKEILLEIGADTTYAEENLQTALDNIKSNSDLMAKVGIKIDENTDVSAITAQLQAQTEDVYVNIGAKSEKAENKLEEINNFKFDDKELKITADTTEVQDNLDKVVLSLDKIEKKKDQEITITETTVKKGAPSGSGEISLNGTAHALGTAHSSLARLHSYGRAALTGDWGTKRSGKTLVGELGRELVVSPYTGKWFTVGDNGAEFVDIPKNAIVFNHIQTQELLENGWVSARGTALARGNAMGDGYTPNSIVKGGRWSIPVVQKASKSSDKSDQNNTKEKDKNTEAVKRSTQVFDWVAVRLQYFADKTKKIADTITDYVSNVFKKSQLNKQMNAIGNEIIANKNGAKAYRNKANSIAKSYTYYDDNGGAHSISIPENYKKLVQQGKWSIEDMDTSTDEKKALAEAIQSYSDYIDKAKECEQAVIDLRNEQLELYEDWANIPTDTAEKKIEKLDSKLKQLERDYSKLGGYDVSAMNDNLDKQTQNAEKQMKAYQKALKQADKNDATAERRFDRKQDAFSKKDRKALSKSQRNALKNGTEISTDGIKDTKLLNKINAYNQALQKRTIAENAQREALDNATDAEKEYIETLQSNAQTKFDNIETMFKNRLSEIEHTRSLIDAQINRTETMGHLVSKKYYETLRNTEASNLSELQKEKDALVASLNSAVESGAIKKESEAWYDMQGQINDVTLSIEDATTAMIEYGNSIRDIDWKIFDLLQERISFVSDEAEFLINLMEDEKLYEDSGQLTDKGLSTMGLHGLNYNVAMTQADKYAEKVIELNAELEKDPYNQDVINKRNEYLEQQQEMILAAENSKQAIVDMVRDGIELELDALKELIDTYGDAIDSEKDLYDYQKGVKKQAEEIASLEKQLSAYAGDTSEESRAKIQQINVDLEDARENLQETEYDHYISDQKKLLDDLYSEYEEILNKRLDNVDALISDMIAKVNDGSKEISETISESSSSVGYTLSEQMDSIWKTGEGNISSVLTTYSSNFNSALTTTNTTLGGIYADIQKMVTYLDNQAKDKVGGQSGNNGNGGTEGNSAPKTVQQLGNIVQRAAQNGMNKAESMLSNPASGTVERIDISRGSSLSGAKKLINKLNSKKLTDKELKKHSSLFQYIYKKSQNKNITDDKVLELGNLLHVDGLPKKADKLTSANKKAILAKLKEVGYRNGTSRVPRDMYAWTQEGGQEVVVRRSDGAILTPVARGDMIFNADATSNLYDFMNNPAKFVNGLTPSIPTPAHKSVQESYKVDFGDIHLDFPNVKNYEEMIYALKHDKRFEDTVRSMTTGRLFGGSALRKYK